MCGYCSVVACLPVHTCLSCLTISCESLVYITASWSVSHSPLLHVPAGTSVAVKGEREEKKAPMEKERRKDGEETVHLDNHHSSQLQNQCIAQHYNNHFIKAVLTIAFVTVLQCPLCSAAFSWFNLIYFTRASYSQSTIESTH